MKKDRLFDVAISILTIAYILYFSYFQYIEHITYNTTGLDLGVFMQSLYTLCRYRLLLVNNAEGPFVYGMAISLTHFAVHNSPILFIIAPLYCIFPSAFTLLLIQTLALGITAIIVYKFSVKVLENRALAFLLALLYLSNPSLHGINAFDFHPSIFAIPLLLLTIYLIDKNNHILALISSLFALMCKEDISLGVLGIGLWLLYRSLKYRYNLNMKLFLKNLKNDSEIRIGLLLVLLSIIWLVLSVFIIIPYFSPIHVFPFKGWYYTKSSLTIDMGHKFMYTLTFLSAVGFLPLWLLDEYLTLTLIPWAEIWFSNRIYMYMYGFCYSYNILPLTIAASIYALKKIYDSTHNTNVRKLFLTFTIFTAFFTILFVNPVPPSLGKDISIVFYRPFFKITNRTRFLSMLTSIVSNKQVCASDRIFPHVANNIHSYLGFWGIKYCKYVIIDYPNLVYFFNLQRLKKLIGNIYNVYYAIDGIYIFRRSYRGPLHFINITHFLYLTLSYKNKTIIKMQITSLQISNKIFIILPNNFTLSIEGCLRFRSAGSYKFLFILPYKCWGVIRIINDTIPVRVGKTIYISTVVVDRPGHYRFLLTLHCSNIRHFYLYAYWSTPTINYLHNIPRDALVYCKCSP